MEQLPPAFWVVCVALGLPGIIALLSKMWTSKKDVPHPVPLPLVTVETVERELEIEKKAREKEQRLWEERLEEQKKFEEQVAEEQKTADTPEKVVDYLKDVGRKIP